MIMLKRAILIIHGFTGSLYDNEYLMIRPSGTENKIKVYYFAYDSSKELANNRLNSLVNITTEIFDKISK